ncbi:SCO family protein [Pedobacter alpinus]|uniref:SCO family protein n=1 Tax=Pedobacter alpinus TaxID=1590643 RepID=A0ABW5TNZ9_9SPHI
MSRNKFPLKKILILVTILAVPGFLYYLLQAKGKNRYKPLPILGPKIVAGTFHTKRGEKIPDTIYHAINYPVLFDSNGDSVLLAKNTQQLIIVNFFYSRNKEVLPLVNEQLSALQEEYKDNKRIKFVSISIDPDFDKPNLLKSFETEIGAKFNKWNLLTADTSVTYRLARNQFFVNAVQIDKNNFIFSDKLILLDADNRIRGYYTGTSRDEGKRLSDEIKVLITEELRKIKVEG